MQRSDAELVAAACRGDLASFGRLYERHYRMAVGIARSRLSDGHLAEDAAQEAAEASKNNAEQQAMAAEVKGKQDAAKEQIKTQGSLAILDKELENSMALAKEEARLEMQLDNNKSKNKIDEILAAGLSDLDDKTLGDGVKEPKVIPTKP